MDPLAAILRSWLPWAVLGAAAGAMYVGQPALAAVLVVSGVLGALAASIARTKSRYASDPLESLSLDAQARIRPLIRARNALAETAERNPENPAISVIGAEAVAESDEIIRQTVNLLKSRSELQRATSTANPARIDELRSRAELADDPVEKQRLEAAIASAGNAEGHEVQRRLALGRIDAQVDEAREAIEGISRQLAAALTQTGASDDDLRSRLLQLQSLGASLEEANALLNETT